MRLAVACALGVVLGCKPGEEKKPAPPPPAEWKPPIELVPLAVPDGVVAVQIAVRLAPFEVQEYEAWRTRDIGFAPDLPLDEQRIAMVPAGARVRAKLAGEPTQPIIEWSNERRVLLVIQRCEGPLPPALRHVDCEDVTDAGLVELGTLPLESFSTRFNRRLGAEARAQLGKMTSLRYLDIAFVDDADLARIGELTHLEALGLQGVFDSAAFALLENLTSLEVLYVPHTTVDDAAMASIAKLAKLTTLAVPRKVTELGLAHLAGLSHLESLTKTGSLTPAGIEAIGRLTTLRHLAITNADALPALFPLTKLPQLEVLDLGATPADASTVPLLEQLPKLRHVYVSGTKIRKPECAELTRARKALHCDLGIVF